MAATPPLESASRTDQSAWQGFRTGLWQKEINLRDFIQQNYIAQIAGFAAELGDVERVEVLAFHQMGRFKWQALGIRYALEHVESPTSEALGEACRIFRAQGLTAH